MMVIGEEIGEVIVAKMASLNHLPLIYAKGDERCDERGMKYPVHDSYSGSIAFE